MSKKQEIAVQTEGPLAEVSVGDIMMNAPLLAQIDHMAERMASAKNTMPKHLQGNVGDCWAIIMQSVQWGLNPFVCAQKTHLVNGTLGYEAQLVNAVVQSGKHAGRFHYEYQGDGPDLACRVGAVLRGESEITWGEWLAVSAVKIQNSPLWKTNPKQQLGYLQVKNWVRAYCPGALLGVYTTDELEQAPVKDMGHIRPVQPAESRTEALTQRLQEMEPEVTPEAEVAEEAVEAPEESDNILSDMVDVMIESAEQAAEKPEVTYAIIAEKINKAASLDALIQVSSEYIQPFIEKKENYKFRDELADLYIIRKTKLEPQK